MEAETTIATIDRSQVDLSEAWRLFPHTFAYHASRTSKISTKIWKPYKYLVYALQIIADAVHKGGARIIINMPPRHGKSFTFSQWFAIWYLTQYEHHNIILASYSLDLARAFSRKNRDEIKSNPRIKLKLNPDKATESEWETAAGGGLKAAGIGTQITGRGFNVGIIDDVLSNWKQTMSDAFLKEQADWYEGVFMNRAEPDASVIIPMTRWCEKDLTGFIVKKKEHYTIIQLPAIAEENDAVGRAPGEALCPERYPIQVLREIQKRSPFKFAALWQQDPKIVGGNMFRDEWWKYFPFAPEEARSFLKVDDALLSLDCAFEKNPISYVCMCAIVRSGVNFYFLDVIRKKISFKETKQTFRAFIGKWSWIEEKLIEAKANGPAIISELEDDIGGLIRWQPWGKVAQANAVAPHQESGNLWLPENAGWSLDWIDEWGRFPGAANDDQVDCGCQGVLRLLEKKRRGEEGEMNINPESLLADSGKESPWDL